MAGLIHLELLTDFFNEIGPKRTFRDSGGETAFEGQSGTNQALLIALDLRGFAVSSGSACSSGATEPSHVLAAIGLTREQARSSVRFSLGRSNTAGQVDALIEAVAEVVAHLRKLAPAYA